MIVMFSTLLAFLISPAMAYLYANIYGNDSSPYMNLCLIMTAMITTTWILFTFSLAYGDDANNERILGFPVTFYMFRDVGPAPVPAYAPTIPMSAYAMFHLALALVPPTIIAHDLIGRVNTFGFLVFILAWHMVVYCPAAHMTWHPRGYLIHYDMQDYAGGVVINVLTSASILACDVFLDWKGVPAFAVKIPRDKSKALRSTLLVWMLWFGLTVGRAYNAGTVAAQAVVNTVVAVQTSILFGYCMDCAYGMEKSSVSLLSNILVGLVAITPAAGYTTAGGAMVIAVVTSLSSKLVGRYLLDDGVQADDPLDTLTVHGIGGSVGYALTGAASYKFINPDNAVNGAFYGNIYPFLMHLLAVVLVWILTFVGVLALIYLTDLVVPVSAQVESSIVYRPPFSHITPQESFVKTNNALAKKLEKPQSEAEARALAREMSMYKQISHLFHQQQEEDANSDGDGDDETL